MPAASAKKVHTSMPTKPYRKNPCQSHCLPILTAWVWHPPHNHLSLTTLHTQLPSSSSSVLPTTWFTTGYYRFQEGHKVGYSEGTALIDGMNLKEVVKMGVDRNRNRGDLEKQTWGAADHSNICITVAHPPWGVAVQKEIPLPHSVLILAQAVQVEMPKPLPTTPVLPCTINSTVQTVSFRTQNASSQTLSSPIPITTSAPFDLVNNVSSPSIIPLLPSKQPQDLSSLHSLSQ